jgi:hypothetical protein
MTQSHVVGLILDFTPLHQHAIANCLLMGTVKTNMIWKAWLAQWRSVAQKEGMANFM